MGECHINGYMKGARTELPLKMITAARINRRTINGINHHFFSCLRNNRNSLQSCHMLDSFDSLATPVPKASGEWPKVSAGATLPQQLASGTQTPMNQFARRKFCFC